MYPNQFKLDSSERECYSCTHRSKITDKCNLLNNVTDGERNGVSREDARSNSSPCGPFGLLYERSCINCIPER